MAINKRVRSFSAKKNSARLFNNLKQQSKRKTIRITRKRFNV